MITLTALWIPILVSAVIVFFASSVIHMAPLWHKNDYPKVPDEEGVQNALRPLAIPPGDYMVPRIASPKDMQSPEFLKKMNDGPVMIMTVLPNGPIGMGGSLAQWFVYCLVVSLFTAYVAGRALPAGTEYLHVFQIAGTVAFVGYTLAVWQMSIWYKRAWKYSLTQTLDGLIYGSLTAGTFGWLWPG